MRREEIVKHAEVFDPRDKPAVVGRVSAVLKLRFRVAFINGSLRTYRWGDEGFLRRVPPHHPDSMRRHGSGERKGAITKRQDWSKYDVQRSTD